MGMAEITATFPLDSFWAIEPLAADRLREALQAHGIEAMRAPRGIGTEFLMWKSGGVAVIDITGPMTKRAGMFQVLFNASATNLVQLAVEAAVDDDDVGAILLRVDSPGGSVDGLAELADTVFAARRQKTVWAQFEGLGASAAYYVASQAEKIFAGRMDRIGSIGTRMMLYDWKGWFDSHQVKAIPIDTGQFKSAGALGTEITDEHKAYFQEIVDGFQADFLATIVRGRGMTMEAVKAVAEGKIYLAGEAVGLGLIDGIQTFDETLAQLGELAARRSKSFNNRTRSQKIMAKDNEAAVDAEVLEGAVGTLKVSGPQAATYEQLASAIPKADNDFVVSQLKNKATVEQARDAWTAELQGRLEAKDKEIADAKAKAASPGIKKALGTGGADPEAGGGEWDDPVAEFNQRMGKQMAAGKTRQQAIRSVAKGDRRLHEAMLRATNKPHRKVQELIGERFELQG